VKSMYPIARCDAFTPNKYFPNSIEKGQRPKAHGLTLRRPYAALLDGARSKAILAKLDQK